MTREPEKEIAERFQRDTAEHVMTVLHDDGLYRHLYCGKPGTGIFSFEIVTWPGALVIRGDFSNHAYVFRRITDMFEFFRSDKGRINAHYWSEKLAGGRSSVLEHSEDRAHRQVTECVAEYETDVYPHLRDRYTQRVIPTKPTPPAEVRERVADYEADGAFAFADGTRELLAELERMGVTSDTWEWDLRDWDWSFLWACHAIVWGIAQYDGAQQKPVVTVAVPGVS